MGTVLVSSLPGIHQNSNLTTGGGTDDTSIIQTALTNGPFPLTLVQDGVSLITGLNLLSNTILQCNTSCGFYLANASNREMVRNVNRSKTTVTDTNITLDGGTYNGNSANQSGSGTSGTQFQADNTPINGVAFYGITNLTIKNLTIHNSKAWAGAAGNYTSVLVNNCTFLQDTVVSNLVTDGFDLRGPGSNATLSNLTVTVGDDGLALNSRAYTTIGPFIGGGNITNTVINTVNFNTSWAGIDIISDGTFSVSDVYISAISGAVQNYAIYLNRDLFTTPAGNGVYSNIFLAGSTCTQSGTPFGAPIPSGLWIIDGAVDWIELDGLTPTAQLVNFPTSNGVATIFASDGQLRGVSGTTTIYTGLPYFAQANSIAHGTTVANLSVAYVSHVTAGTLLLAFSFGFVAGGATISSITDTVGTSLTWTSRGTFTDGATGHVGQIWTAVSLASEAHTVKVTYSTTMAVIGMMVAEYGQPSQGCSFDTVSALGFTASVTTVSCPNITTTKPEFIIAAGSSGTAAGGVTAGSGYTLRKNGDTSIFCVLEDIVELASNTYTPSWTQTAGASYNHDMALSNAAQTAFTISGNAGIASATVSYSGTASGTTTSDSGGNFKITGLAAGSYTVTPTISAHYFVPASTASTISTDITGLQFVANSGTAPVGNAGSLSLRRRKRRDVIS